MFHTFFRRPTTGVRVGRSYATAAPRVLVSRDDGVATVTLNRSSKMNACDVQMFEELSAAGGVSCYNPHDPHTTNTHTHYPSRREGAG